MSVKTALRLWIGLGVGLAAGPVLAQHQTNGYQYGGDSQYSNHWAYTNSGGEGGYWWTNMSRWSNAPVPRAFTNQHSVVAPKSGAGVEPPGPRPGGPITPADVQALVQQFQQDRQAFMARQKALETQMKGLPEQERQKIREQLKEQMEQWKQQQARLREQLQAQCDRLAEQLRDHNRILNRVANPDASSGGSGGTRPRGR